MMRSITLAAILTCTFLSAVEAMEGKGAWFEAVLDPEEKQEDLNVVLLNHRSRKIADVPYESTWIDLSGSNIFERGIYAACDRKSDGSLLVHAWSDHQDPPLGTGPFKIKPNHHYRITATYSHNPRFWGARGEGCEILIEEKGG